MSKDKKETVITVDVMDLLTPVAILISGFMISLVIFFGLRGLEVDTVATASNGSNNNAVAGANDSANNAPSADLGDTAAPAEQQGFQKATTNVDDDPFVGDEDAPVTIVEYSDYECPFCKRHFDQTYPTIKSEYIDNGDVKMVYRDNALSFHPLAKPAAIAANCAREQGGNDRYFEMHDAIFNFELSSAAPKNHTVETLDTIAENVGLNMDEFNDCMDENDGAEIDQDMADAASAGCEGTPCFVIGVENDEGVVEGKKIEGAYPFVDFDTVIQEYL